MEAKTKLPVGILTSPRYFECDLSGALSFFKRMRNRLIILAGVALALFSGGLPSVRGAVIDFEDPADLARFNQVTSAFWSRTSGAGLSGGAGLTGPNSGTPGWVVYKTPVSPTAATFSGGIYLKLAPPTSTSSGFSLLFGVGSSPTYVPNLGTVVNADQNHFNAAIHYTQNDNPRRFRVAAQASNGGTVTTNYGDYSLLDYDAWYYLSLESTFDADTELYSINVHLYASSSAGVLGTTPLMSIAMENVSLPGLAAAEDAYLFFGIDGRSETRGISALDRFTYQTIPEPSTVALAVLAGLALIAGRRRGKRHRTAAHDPMATQIGE